MSFSSSPSPCNWLTPQGLSQTPSTQSTHLRDPQRGTPCDAGDLGVQRIFLADQVGKPHQVVHSNPPRTMHATWHCKSSTADQPHLWITVAAALNRTSALRDVSLFRAKSTLADSLRAARIAGRAELTLFVLLTPRLYRENPSSRLYGWLIDNY